MITPSFGQNMNEAYSLHIDPLTYAEPTKSNPDGSASATDAQAAPGQNDNNRHPEVVSYINAVVSTAFADVPRLTPVDGAGQFNLSGEVIDIDTRTKSRTAELKGSDGEMVKKTITTHSASVAVSLALTDAATGQTRTHKFTGGDDSHYFNSEEAAIEAALNIMQGKIVKYYNKLFPLTVDGASDNRNQIGLYLRANLLRWATLTPDLGLELRFKQRYALVVNGSWTSWSWNDKDRRYALREIAPEFRYYIGKKCRGYVGAMYKVGAFNYKFSEYGKQGNILGGGITGGYALPLNRCLSLDFSLGLGYLHANYDRYNVIDGVRVHQGRGEKDWWGPISAAVTLTWKIL